MSELYYYGALPQNNLEIAPLPLHTLVPTSRRYESISTILSPTALFPAKFHGLNILTGAESRGKTLVSSVVAMEKANFGGNVTFISTENTPSPWLTGKLLPFTDRIQHLSIGPGCTADSLSQLIYEIYTTVRRTPHDICIIDSLDAISFADDQDATQKQYSDFIHSLNRIALKEGIPILMTMQWRQEYDLSHLLESGESEKAEDVDESMASDGLSSRERAEFLAWRYRKDTGDAPSLISNSMSDEELAGVNFDFDYLENNSPETRRKKFSTVTAGSTALAHAWQIVALDSGNFRENTFKYPQMIQFSKDEELPYVPLRAYAIRGGTYSPDIHHRSTEVLVPMALFPVGKSEIAIAHLEAELAYLHKIQSETEERMPTSVEKYVGSLQGSGPLYASEEIQLPSINSSDATSLWSFYDESIGIFSSVIFRPDGRPMAHISLRIRADGKSFTMLSNTSALRMLHDTIADSPDQQARLWATKQALWKNSGIEVSSVYTEKTADLSKLPYPAIQLLQGVSVAFISSFGIPRSDMIKQKDVKLWDTYHGSFYDLMGTASSVIDHAYVNKVAKSEHVPNQKIQEILTSDAQIYAEVVRVLPQLVSALEGENAQIIAKMMSMYGYLDPSNIQSWWDVYDHRHAKKDDQFIVTTRVLQTEDEVYSLMIGHDVGSSTPSFIRCVREQGALHETIDFLVGPKVRTHMDAANLYFRASPVFGVGNLQSAQYFEHGDYVNLLTGSDSDLDATMNYTYRGLNLSTKLLGSLEIYVCEQVDTDSLG